MISGEIRENARKTAFSDSNCKTIVKSSPAPLFSPPRSATFRLPPTLPVFRPETIPLAPFAMDELSRQLFALLLAVLWYGFGLYGYNAPLSTNTAPVGFSNITTRNPSSQ